MLVLLDRDGVINEDLPTGVLTLEEFVFLPRAIQGIVKLTNAGFTTAVCTNQSAIGKGILRQETLGEIHAFMCAQITKAGGNIDAIYYAPEAPHEPSTRRKPAPGMLLEAMEQFKADPARTPFVGDMLRDLNAAFTAGCPRILTRTGKGAAIEAQGIPAYLEPVVVMDDLSSAADYILANYR